MPHSESVKRGGSFGRDYRASKVDIQRRFGVRGHAQRSQVVDGVAILERSGCPPRRLERCRKTLRPAIELIGLIRVIMGEKGR